MFHIESLINGRWTRISSSPRTAERAANNVAYLVEEDGFAEAEDNYRIVPA